VAEVTARTQLFLEPLFNDNANIRVVQFGYDILTFSKGILCPVLGSLVFHHCAGNITCVNTDFIQMQYQYVDGLDKLYDRHDSVNLLGTVQAAGGVPGASTGHPNLAYYSPDDLMLDNCIHPNDQGFTDVFAKFWELYFAPRINATSTVAMNQDNQF